jgi:hypothetical protein
MFDAKKGMELRALLAAQSANSLLPNGQIVPSEEPDFRIVTESGVVGVELSEIMPLPRSNSFSSPVAEEHLREEIIRTAEHEYYSTPGAVPVKLSAFFWNIERGKNKKREMVERLVSFVKSHCHEAAPVSNFGRRTHQLDCFNMISIDSSPGPWWGGGSSGNTFESIQQQFASRIEAKSKLLPRYRANLPNSPIWLLLFSCAGVARGVAMPHCISEWSFPFEFDRLLFYASLDGSVEEIHKANAK